MLLSDPANLATVAEETASVIRAYLAMHYPIPIAPGFGLPVTWLPGPTFPITALIRHRPDHRDGFVDKPKVEHACADDRQKNSETSVRGHQRFCAEDHF